MPKIDLASVQSGGLGRAPRAPSKWPLSEQQESVLAHVNDSKKRNLLLEARAGCAKTSTLIEVCKDLSGGAAFLAFNKAISVEIQRQLATEGIGKAVEGKTFHAVGLAAWRKFAPQAASNVRGEKLSILSDKISMPRSFQTFARHAVSLAKQSLFGAVPELSMDEDFHWKALVEHHDLLDFMPDSDHEIDPEEWLEQALAWSLKLLKQSIAESTSIIDFDDMIYMPLLENLRFWQYDWVLVDEAQDTNRARREIAKKLLRPDGRLIAVGDRFQAIYGFTGADSDALDLIQEDFLTDILPLTTTYRCATSVVELAQTWVPDIQARSGAPAGVTRHISRDEFAKLTPEPTDAILCRNTKPLVEVAFGYLRRHVACHVEGREIGASLITLIKKYRSAQSMSELIASLEDYLEKEKVKLLAKYQEAKLAQIEDKIQTIIVLAGTFAHSDHPSQLIGLIERLFKDTDGLQKQTITLSTIHKAKGREWHRVYLLGRNTLMPSGYAKQDWQLQQERNLMYVAVTRAKEELIDVDFEARKR